MSNLQDKILEPGRFGSRGLPSVKFVEDVSDLVGQDPSQMEAYIAAYRELHSKMQMMYNSLTTQQTNLKQRQASLRQSQQVIEMSRKHLKQQPNEPMKSLMKADDVLYAQCEVIDPSKTLLWLGSNVVVEYSLDEADEVLTRQVQATQLSIDNLITDIRHVRAQTVVIEMTISRIYNLFVTLQQKGPLSVGPRASMAQE